jgi:NAD(P)-dependent dehydrogenase (short-subunit alcohol dehydrogenase family)
MWTDVLNKIPAMFGETAGQQDNLAFFAATRTPLRREQTPEDIGEAVVYLCQADNVTGIALNVAGGAEVN